MSAFLPTPLRRHPAANIILVKLDASIKEIAEVGHAS